MGGGPSSKYAPMPTEPRLSKENEYPRYNNPKILLDNGIDEEMLNPNLDNDPSVVRDRGKCYYWQEYCILEGGWHRFALKVRGIYEDDNWLSNKEVWQTAFHGTPIENIGSILREGYRLGEKVAPNGFSVYTSPALSLAFNYGEEFDFKGQEYHAIIENRVNIQQTQIDNKTNYWLSSHCNQTIRPCAILILDDKWSPDKLFSLEKQCSQLWNMNR